MKKKTLLVLACASLLVTSCVTVRKTATTVAVNTEVNQFPTVVDLDVQPKVEVTTTWSFRPFNLGEPSYNVAKGNLIAETLKEKNADVLLEPQVIFQKTSFGERKMTISGYPASYKNFRKATDEDLEALKVVGRPSSRSIREVGGTGVKGFFQRIFRR